jgi:hypothetical protein
VKLYIYIYIKDSKNHPSQQNKLMTQVIRPRKPHKTHTETNYKASFSINLMLKNEIEKKKSTKKRKKTKSTDLNRDLSYKIVIIPSKANKK